MIRAYDEKSQLHSLSFEDIQEIELFVNDFFTIDQMGFQFTTTDGQVYVCNEDSPVFKETFKELTVILPEFDQAVADLYRTANMCLEPTKLYDRQNGVIEFTE